MSFDAREVVITVDRAFAPSEGDHCWTTVLRTTPPYADIDELLRHADGGVWRVAGGWRGAGLGPAPGGGQRLLLAHVEGPSELREGDVLRGIGIDTTQWWTVDDPDGRSWEALAAQILAGARPRAPLVCPVCGSVRGHVCMHARRSLGRLWLWCTACLSYRFDRKRTPEGWINLQWLTMPECEYALPQCLLDRVAEVDAHWNRWVDGHASSA